MSGKRGTCPAGHPGVHILPSFVLCTFKDCDGTPRPRCSQCGSADLYEFIAPTVPLGSIACRKCGKVTWQA